MEDARKLLFDDCVEYKNLICLCGRLHSTVANLN